MQGHIFYIAQDAYSPYILVLMLLLPLASLAFSGNLRQKSNRAVAVFAGLFFVWLGLKSTEIYMEYSFIAHGGAIHGDWEFTPAPPVMSTTGAHVDPVQLNRD